MDSFSVVGSRYIFCDGKHVCTVIRDEGAYVPPLLKRLNKYPEENYALAILDKMIESMSALREPVETDRRVIESYLNPPVTVASKYGKKHMCAKCSQKFYDLNGRVTECPGCKSPLEGP